MIEESSTAETESTPAEIELTVVEVGGEAETATPIQEILTPPSPPVNEEGQLGLAFAGEDIRQLIIRMESTVSAKRRVVEDAIEEASADVPKFREGSKFVDDVYKGKNLDLAKRNLDHLRMRASDLMETFERASAALAVIIETQQEIESLRLRELGVAPAVEEDTSDSEDTGDVLPEDEDGGPI